MHIEVDYNGRGTTVVLEVDCSGHGTTHGSACALFCEDQAVGELSIFCVADGCWVDDRGNEGSCECTTITICVQIFAAHNFRGF